MNADAPERKVVHLSVPALYRAMGKLQATTYTTKTPFRDHYLEAVRIVSGIPELRLHPTDRNIVKRACSMHHYHGGHDTIVLPYTTLKEVK